MDLKAKNNSLGNNSAITGTDSEQTAPVQGVASNEITTKVEEDNKKILIVDDEPDLVDTIQCRLEYCKYEVITAANGKEGLEKAKTERPDLIILDLLLPMINGYKICGLLKRDTKYAKIPIILLTAKTQEKDMKLGEQVGADAYLTKPFEPDVLLATIKELIKG